LNQELEKNLNELQAVVANKANEIQTLKDNLPEVEKNEAELKEKE
jgi:hypothetical protein